MIRELKKCIKNLIVNVDWKYILVEFLGLIIFIIPFFCWSNSRYISVLLFFTACILFLVNKRIIVDIRSIMAFLLVLISRFIGNANFKSIIVYSSIVILFMIVLDNSMRICDEHQIDFVIKKMLYSLCYGFFAEVIICIAAYFRDLNIGIINHERRGWPSYFFYVDMRANSYEFFSVISVSLFIYAIYVLVKYRRIQGLFLLITSIISLFFWYIYMQQRGIILIWGICVVLGTYIWWREKKFWLKKVNRYAILLVLSISLVLVFVAIKKYGDTDIWLRDGGIISNVRFNTDLLVISQLFKYPFGGCNMNIGDLESVHNYWLEIAYVGGVIPFVISIIILCICLKDMFVFFNKKNIGIEMKLFLGVPFCGVMCWLMTEPCYFGSPIPPAVFYGFDIVLKNYVNILSNEVTNNEK